MDNLSGRSYGTLSAYTPTLREKVQAYLAQNIFGDTKDGYATAKKVTDALDYTPLGLGTAAYDVGRSGAAGDWLGAAIAAGTMLPIGKAGKGLRGYRVDNPGGEWLLRKQQDALKSEKYLRGATTAHVGMEEPLMLSVDELAKLTGVNNEKPLPGNPKFDALLKSVKEKGYTNENPVMVFVNHKGEAYINEGNNRVAVAKHLNVPAIKAWVHWRNGGEAAKGPWSPDSLLNYIREK